MLNVIKTCFGLNHCKCTGHTSNKVDYKSSYPYYSRKSLFSQLFSMICKIANKIVLKMLFINFSLIEQSLNISIRYFNE